MFKALKAGNKFTKNVITLVTGTSIAQFIGIAISPILTRLYSPQEFGILALFVTISSTISIFATGRYEIAIMLPKDELNAKYLVLISIILALTVCTVFIFIFSIFNVEINDLIGNHGLSIWLYFVPLSVFSICFYQSMSYWCNRRGDYETISKTKIIQSGVTGVSGVCMGLSGFGSSGLVLASVFGQILSALSIWRMTKRGYCSGGIEFKLSKIIELVISYKNHPLYLTLSYGISAIYMAIPVFFIGKIYGLSILGFYSLSYKMISLPGSLIASAIGNVFRQRATEEFHAHGKFNQILLTTVKHTVLISIIPFSLLYFWAEDLFVFVFGESWRVAGDYARILTIGAFFSFVITPIDKAALITNQIKYILAWHSIRLICNIILVATSIILGFSIIQYLNWMVALNIFFYLIDFHYEYKFSKGI